jgi:hypothetical protein
MKHAPQPSTLSVTDTKGVNEMNDWSRQMGEKHGRRDRAASLQAQTLVDSEHDRHAACLERWPTIVVAMKTLIAGYNHGTGLNTLTLVEDSVNPSVTLESARTGHSSLVIALDGADVSVRTHNGAAAGTRWVSLNRTDENAAEYLLRDWMEQL